MSASAELCVVMMSGGLDSTVLAYWLLARGQLVLPLFVNYGQHCASVELETLREVLPANLTASVSSINISDIFRSSSSRLIVEADLWKQQIAADEIMLPYRNSLLLTAAAAFASSRGLATVYAAFINSNHALEIDATAQFLESFGKLMSRLGRVRVELPFRDMSKREVAKIGLSLGVPIARTFSCQVNSRVHCGSCPNCVDRLAALQDLEG